MKMQMIDSLDENEAREFTGCKVIDESGEPVGTVDGFWMDPSTHRVAFLGVKSSWLSGNVHVVPARDAQLAEQDNLVKLGYPTAFIEKAPTFSPEGELAQVEKEEVNAYFGRITSLRRTSSIEEIRPEEAINSKNSGEEAGTQDKSERSVERLNLERSDQAFFNQKGFVTDSIPEVDASKELQRTQKDAKVRNREDQIKRGSSD
jgi:sporulation protein YlmC with PRC-barrel domain